jgi:hypothetical protein
VPDILVRHIDEATAERVKAIARERGWSINEVILYALRHGVGLGGEDMPARAARYRASARAPGSRRKPPRSVPAVDAFERVDGKPLYEDGDDKPK